MWGQSEACVCICAAEAVTFVFTRAVFENRVYEAIQKYKEAEAKEEVWQFIDTMIDTEKMIIDRMIENNVPLEKIAQLIGFSVEKVKEILETEKVYH